MNTSNVWLLGYGLEQARHISLGGSMVVKPNCCVDASLYKPGGANWLPLNSEK